MKGERVEYNSSKRVRDDVRSLRYVWFGFKVWYIWACYRAATHTTAALAMAVHTFSSGAMKRQSEQKHEDLEEAKGINSHHCWVADNKSQGKAKLKSEKRHVETLPTTTRT